jgi:crossover junction endodeoxyribonuclease RusA
MQDPIKLVLPWPPSVNHYWKRNSGCGVRVGAQGKRFRKDVEAAVMVQVKPSRLVTGPVAVQIIACQPDRRKRDLDNLLKATLDSLTHAGVYDDDSKIHSLRIEWGDRVKGGMLDVTVSPFAGKQAA